MANNPEHFFLFAV